MEFKLFYNLGSQDRVEFSSWSKLMEDTRDYQAVDFDLERDGLPTVSKTINRAWLGATPDDMVEFFVDMAGEGLFNADQVYTHGNCEVFAAALLEFLPDGVPIAVYDPVNPETGRKVRGAPFLIHAGVLVDDTVYDVRGAHDATAWAGRW